MDSRVHECPKLTDDDLALLEQIEAGMPITADISRADLLLCTLLPDGQALVASHGLPQSISSLYKQSAIGRVFTVDEHPLVLRALCSGSGGRRQREVVRNGAPVIEDVYPVYNRFERVIAALMVETNMIAHERQKRRDRHFRQAVDLLLDMCVRGEIEGAAQLTRFGLYDGAYLVDRTRNVVYMSGIAANLFRTIGLQPSHHRQPISALEPVDVRLVEYAFVGERCREEHSEEDDGRTWIRRAIPLRGPSQLWRNRWFASALPSAQFRQTKRQVEQVLVLLHNATESVAKQRELAVKSALIQEVHHRVKNNLQNIAAILRMQARRSQSEETRQHLSDAVNRVLSMSVIHEYLSQAESRSINVRDVCQRVANQVSEVSRNPEQDIEIRVRGPNVRLPASQATPATMVVNELLLNALEHGMKGRTQGRITLTLSDLGDAVKLEVQDNGGGLPPDFEQRHNGSLGLQIIRTLVKDDLKGTLEYISLQPEGAASVNEAGEDLSGARVVVVFPKRPLNAD